MSEEKHQKKIRSLTEMRIELENACGIECARTYYAEHHDLNVPEDYVCENGFHLGRWLSQTMIRRKKNKVPEDVIQQLDEMHFSWHHESKGRPGRKPLDYAARIAHIEQFAALHHHLNVPKDYICEDGFVLGKWLHTVKYKRIRGTLPQDVEAQLSAMGLIWNAREQAWMVHFQECKEYLQTHPGEGIPREFHADSGTDLHIWFMKNHRAYQKGELSQEKAELFSEIDYDPKSERLMNRHASNTLNEDWVKHCLELKAFYEAHRHLRLPKELPDLRKWFWTQRSIFRKGGYSAARMQFLEENNMTELFQAPIRKGTVKVSLWLDCEVPEELMKKARADGCESLEEYLVKLARE